MLAPESPRPWSEGALRADHHDSGDLDAFSNEADAIECAVLGDRLVRPGSRISRDGLMSQGVRDRKNGQRRVSIVNRIATGECKSTPCGRCVAFVESIWLRPHPLDESGYVLVRKQCIDGRILTRQLGFAEQRMKLPAPVRMGKPRLVR
jgi:hypothetical protein